jgi:hypothetical protein
MRLRVRDFFIARCLAAVWPQSLTPNFRVSFAELRWRLHRAEHAGVMHGRRTRQAYR